jgi:hypothetical protein
LVQTAHAPSRTRQATHRHCSRGAQRGQTREDFCFLQLGRRMENPSRCASRKMSRTTTFCAVIMLVMALSIASAGAFACQIVCVVAPAAPLASHTGSCSSHAGMPGNSNSGHQHAGHSHTRIVAAAQSSAQQTSLQQTSFQRTGLLPQIAAGLIAAAGASHTQAASIATSKSSSLFSTTPVLRI